MNRVIESDRVGEVGLGDHTSDGSANAGHGGSLRGVVVDVLPRALYRVELESRRRILAHPSRDARRNFVRILVGDHVEVSLSPRNGTRGRITARL